MLCNPNKSLGPQLLFPVSKPLGSDNTWDINRQNIHNLHPHADYRLLSPPSWPIILGHMSNRASVPPRDFKTAVLAQFEPDLAMSLIEFAKSLRSIEADVLMFMARKSLCLYDVLVRLGIPPVERCVVSDRVLDMSLEKLAGKRVALIDDTLILGTTLAKAKQQLLDAGVGDVRVHTFCVDDKWWCKDLIDPDHVGIHLADDRVMTFCSAAVRAMSLLPRPYLVDFPLSRPLKVPSDEAQCFLSDIEWRAYNISSQLQRKFNVSSLSFFPNADAEERILSAMGSSFRSLIDILKVRGFARKNRDVYWLQIVPIVVLKPIRTGELQEALKLALIGVRGLDDSNRDLLLSYANTPQSQQRLLQYLLSCIIGHQFIGSMRQALSRPLRFSFDMVETDRHYGPWLHDPMKALTETDALEGMQAFVAPPSFSACQLPEAVRNLALKSQQDGSRGEAPNLFRKDDIYNLIPGFSEVFLSLYDEREIPARREAKKLGSKVLSDRGAIPHRSRLEVGLPWPNIVEHLLRHYGIQRTAPLEQVFSLVLDFCNDQGIAVPVTCLLDGVVYRAFRHGEDVKFTDAELSLAYEVVKGFLEATQGKAIQKLKLEKLLVLLLKIGVARGFLEPLLLSGGGVQEVLRIGFYLRGAVPIIARGSNERADREDWFSHYLVQRGVLIPGERKFYELGREVQGNHRSTTAPDESYELGSIVGLLTRAKKSSSRRDAPLDDNAITLLASCGTPRHAAASIQVELELFREWFEGEGRTDLRKIKWSSTSVVTKCLKRLVLSNGHVAIHGTRLKFVGYRTNEPARLIGACEQYLAEQHGELVRRKWASYWKAAQVLEASGEKATFDPLINEATRVCWEVGLWFSVIEICLARYVVDNSKDPTASDYLQAALRKYGEYSRALKGTSLEPPPNAEAVLQLVSSLDSGTGNAPLISAFNIALRSIEDMLPRISARAEVMSPMIEEFGRITGRRDYQYMLYYDIVDSTGTVAGRMGEDLVRYRTRVSQIKRFLNGGFRELAQTARSAASEVFCWNGDQSSTNDCKHVFVGGTSATLYLHRVIQLLLNAMEAVPTICLRVYVVPCNFAGSSAFRQEWDTEISGDRFWEYWSRLMKGSKKFEEESGPREPFLLVAVKELIETIVIPKGWLWQATKQSTVSSEIELLAKSTLVQYGALAATRAVERKRQ